MQFCVTVCEFSVANSVSGVRKMLPLVWSADAAIKDAVVQAYRRLYLNPQGDTTRSVKHGAHSYHKPWFASSIFSLMWYLANSTTTYIRN